MKLFHNIRFYILLFSALLAGGVYLYDNYQLGVPVLYNIDLLYHYALISLAYLYVALLATPLTKLFPAFPYRAKYIKARRSIGVSAFFFGLLHAILAFFGQVGGIEGFIASTLDYQLGVVFGAVALLILFLMATTSFDFVIEKLGFARWKLLHRFVYVASIAILIHATILGGDFGDKLSPIPLTIYIATTILISLEIVRVYRVIQPESIPPTADSTSSLPPSPSKKAPPTGNPPPTPTSPSASK